MSEISLILEKLKNTRESEILQEMDELYSELEKVQSEWYSKNEYSCPEGCGTCCHNFEPDLLESETLYMAAWLLQNQKETAENIINGKFPYDNGKTCPFHDFDNPYHCTIYKGRAFICRLFGGSCFYGKNGKSVWKPCKFFPIDRLQAHKPSIVHRQYSETEAEQIFKTLPPAMSDFMERAVSLIPDNTETRLLRETLPEAIRRLKWILSLSGNND